MKHLANVCTWALPFSLLFSAWISDDVGWSLAIAILVTVLIAIAELVRLTGVSALARRRKERERRRPRLTTQRSTER